MAVHDVDVEEVGAARLGERDRAREVEQVGGEDRRRDLHRRTSAIRSPPATTSEITSRRRSRWPGSGYWRSTTPGAAPSYGSYLTLPKRKPWRSKKRAHRVVVAVDEVGHDEARAGVGQPHEEVDRRRRIDQRAGGRRLHHDRAFGAVRREHVERATEHQPGRLEAHQHGLHRLLRQIGHLDHLPATRQADVDRAAPLGRSAALGNLQHHLTGARPRRRSGRAPCAS